jgi:hypothetical protein
MEPRHQPGLNVTCRNFIWKYFNLFNFYYISRCSGENSPDGGFSFSFARGKPPAVTHVIRSHVAARKEDFTATGPELEAAPGLNYKIAQKTAKIEPKSNQVRRPKLKYQKLKPGYQN